MAVDDLIPLALYGLIVVLTALGGIFGPHVALVPAAAMAVLWLVILAGHRRNANQPRP